MQLCQITPTELVPRVMRRTAAETRPYYYDTLIWMLWDELIMSGAGDSETRLNALKRLVTHIFADAALISNWVAVIKDMIGAQHNKTTPDTAFALPAHTDDAVSPLHFTLATIHALSIRYQQLLAEQPPLAATVLEAMQQLLALISPLIMANPAQLNEQILEFNYSSNSITGWIFLCETYFSGALWLEQVIAKIFATEEASVRAVILAGLTSSNISADRTRADTSASCLQWMEQHFSVAFQEKLRLFVGQAVLDDLTNTNAAKSDWTTHCYYVINAPSFWRLLAPLVLNDKRLPQSQSVTPEELDLAHQLASEFKKRNKVRLDQQCVGFHRFMVERLQAACPELMAVGRSSKPAAPPQFREPTKAKVKKPSTSIFDRRGRVLAAATIGNGRSHDHEVNGAATASSQPSCAVGSTNGFSSSAPTQ